ncbi:uncharacterized protein LY89DRAFT_719044 [Mollisia scopiformis]|uniref:Uncharacterized protein n=1 Tax=Mollisia scopiformis TaxID=149040 RepID=A0A194X7Z7_MOLSC|nr:uncharacterized protein LY89DRAFT_719044 [Mollisia scopiformis]KUJ16291.1 hypothetical protein LY89DRAFT_719044 [Mollisia scopiformis]
MKLLPVALVPLSFYLHKASAVTWYFLRWYTPDSSVEFTEFSMDMVVPTLPEAATYYLWPGLQDVGTSGVYQEVLDGRSGDWWIGAGWCCSDPTLSWGSGFNVAAGTTVAINMTRAVPNSADWTSVITQGTQTVTDTFPLAYKNMNQALLAIELYDVTWNFGQLVWNNVQMVVNTTETSWCTSAPENYDSATAYTMTTPVVSTSGGITTCTIEQIVMESPA